MFYMHVYNIYYFQWVSMISIDFDVVFVLLVRFGCCSWLSQVIMAPVPDREKVKHGEPGA